MFILQLYIKAIKGLLTIAHAKMSLISVPLKSDDATIVAYFKEPINFSNKIIGLQELVFRKSWKTFSKDQIIGIHEERKDGNRVVLKTTTLLNKVYSSAKELLEIINSKIKDMALELNIDYPILLLAGNKKVSVSKSQSNDKSLTYFPCFSSELLSVLGLNKRFSDKYQDDELSDRIRDVDLDALKKFMFVTCDLTEINMNDMNSQYIIRSVRMDNYPDHDFVRFNFENIHWFEFKKGSHNAMVLSITDDQMNPIAFIYGTVFVTLAIKDKESVNHHFEETEEKVPDSVKSSEFSVLKIKQKPVEKIESSHFIVR